jgi:LCP family protein required for cell wall assembly
MPNAPGTDWRSLPVTVLAPGWPARHAHPVASAVLLAAGLATPLGLAVGIIASGRTWVGLTLDRRFLAWLAIVAVVAALARVIAVWWWFGGALATRWRVGAAIGATALTALPGAFVASGAINARADIAPVFTPTTGDRPLYDADAEREPRSVPAVTSTSDPDEADGSGEPDEVGPSSDDGTVGPGSTSPATVATTTTSTTLPPLPAQPLARIDPARLVDVQNILLLGGDAGPGRWGLRTDTMILFSLHTPSGRASLISIPRSFRDLLFPPGSTMEQRHPYGFDNLANAVYPIVSADPSLRAAYDRDGIVPGVVALAEGIGYSFDVTIHDYVLVDMQGFIDVIDSVGGVTIDVDRVIPMPGNVPGAPTQYPDTIGPGVIEMDGSTALGYVRSRTGDSDYHRTTRQRDLLAALARQVSFTDVIANFGQVTGAIGGTLRTSLTPDQLAEVLAVIGGETAIVESVGLSPPLASPSRPDYQRMAEVVNAVLVAIAEGTPSGY